MIAPATKLESWRGTRTYRVLFTPVTDLVRGRVGPRMDIRTLVAEAGLPGPLGEIVCAVVKRAKLWHVERADVARELIAHFKDGLAAGATPEQLRDSFGTVRPAARLIGRAKWRGRPLWWRGLERFGRASLVVWGVLVVLYLVQTWRLHAGRPDIAHNYLEEWNAGALAIPPAERAWPVYREAELLLGKWPNGPFVDAEAGEEHWREWAAFTQEHAEVVSCFRKAAAMPHLGAVLAAGEGAPAGSDDNPLFMTILLPQLAALRHAGQLLAADAYLAAESGDGERAYGGLVAQLAIADHAYEVNFLIGDLVALGLIARAGDQLGALLVERPELFRDEQLVELAHRFGAVGGGNLCPRPHSEYASFDDVLQRYYAREEDGGLPRPDWAMFVSSCGDRQVMLGGDAARYALPVVSPFLATRQEIAAKFHGFMAAYEQEAATPLWERRRLVDADVDAFRVSWTGRVPYVLLNVLMPRISKALLLGEYVAQRRDATLTAMALELYRRRQGAWPTALDDLVPRYLPRVPCDRYDGGPLKYRIVDGRPVLYSVGVDRNDDGGRPAENVPPTVRGHSAIHWARDWQTPEQAAAAGADGDWVLWPEAEKVTR